MTEPRFVRIVLRIATIAVLSFIYLPIVVLVIYAFNSSRIQTWPPTSFTLQWFVEAAGNPAIVAALKQLVDRGERGNDACPGRSARSRRSPCSATTSSARETISFILVLPLALARRDHGHRPAHVVHDVRHRPWADDDHRWPCHVLRGRRLQQRAGPAAARAAHRGRGVGRPRRRLVHDLPPRHAARAYGPRCCPARCSPSGFRSTRSSSPSSPRAPARRPSRCGSTAPSSGRMSCRWSTWLRVVVILLSVIPVYLAQRLSGDVASASL